MSLHSEGGGAHIAIIESAFNASLMQYAERHADSLSGYSYQERMQQFDLLLEREVRRIKVTGYYALNGAECNIEDPFAPVRAEHFLLAASNDAFNLIHFATLFTEESEIENPNQLLKRSATPLLKVARMSDKHKFELVDDWMYRPGMPEVPSKVRQELELSWGMQIKNAHDGERVLAWTSSVNDWIDERIATGCPAMRMIRQDETGRQVTLLHRFWYEMVDVAHPVE